MGENWLQVDGVILTSVNMLLEEFGKNMIMRDLLDIRCFKGRFFSPSNCLHIFCDDRTPSLIIHL